MNRPRLEQLLIALSQITRDRELVMIGSQAVHTITNDVPDEVLISRECDVSLEEHDPLVSRIDEQLGRDSPYAAESFVHVDTVSSTFPFLPDGWEQRLVPFGPTAPHVRCLEIHDLVLSKLAAGRLKDYELIAILLDRKLADLDAVRDRIAAVSDLRMRAVRAAAADRARRCASLIGKRSEPPRGPHGDAAIRLEAASPPARAPTRGRSCRKSLRVKDDRERCDACDRVDPAACAHDLIVRSERM